MPRRRYDRDVADASQVLQRAPVVGGGEEQRVDAIETAWPGVERVRRSTFMGLRGIANGSVTFKDVRVPAENMVGKPGEGLKIALATLNVGRLGIPAAAIGGGMALVEDAKWWTSNRQQWGQPVADLYCVAADKALADAVFVPEPALGKHCDPGFGGAGGAGDAVPREEAGEPPQRRPRALRSAPAVDAAGQPARDLDHHAELGSDVGDPKRHHLSPKRNARWFKLLYATPALFPIYFRAARRET